MENLELVSKLYTKVFNVMAELGWIEKEGQVSMGNTKYAYATESSFIAAVKPLMIKNNILLVPSNIVSNTQLVQSGEKGEKTTYATSVHAEYKLIDVETGYYEIVSMIGAGNDNGDKHVPKALTATAKYLLRQLFMAGVGEDPEASTEDGEPTSTPPIALAASKYKEITGSPFTKDMLQQLSKAGYVTTNGFGVEENNTAKAIVKIANGVKSGKKFEELIVSK